jgi:hypothetical protein
MAPPGIVPYYGAVEQAVNVEGEVKKPSRDDCTNASLTAICAAIRTTGYLVTPDRLDCQLGSRTYRRRQLRLWADLQVRPTQGALGLHSNLTCTRFVRTLVELARHVRLPARILVGLLQPLASFDCHSKTPSHRQTAEAIDTLSTIGRAARCAVPAGPRMTKPLISRSSFNG